MRIIYYIVTKVFSGLFSLSGLYLLLRRGDFFDNYWLEITHSIVFFFTFEFFFSNKMVYSTPIWVCNCFFVFLSLISYDVSYR